MTPARLVLVIAGARKRAEEHELAAREENQHALDVLIVEAMPMVERNASSIWRHVATRIEKSELMDAGYLALVEASKKFDPERGIPLHAYARRAVRGAMWDTVRRRNWVEMSHLELKVELIETADERQSPEAMFQESRIKEATRAAMENLTDVERFVVQRYYAGNELGAIGVEMGGVPKHTVYRTHKRALGKMQAYFRMRGIKAA